MVNPFHLHNWGKLSGHMRIPVLTEPSPHSVDFKLTLLLSLSYLGT